MAAFRRQAEGVLFLAGTIIGVGMFGIPFSFVRAGFLAGAIELVLLAAVTVVVHLAYAEIIVRAREIHRLPGYVGRYLPSFGWLSRASYLFGLSGTLLAYVILGGFFLGAFFHALFPAIPAAIGPAAFYLIGMGVIAGSIRLEGAVQAGGTVLLVIAILLFSAMILPHVDLSFLTASHPDGWLMPYGVLLFALAGAALIPDVRRLLGSAGEVHLKRVIIIGTLLPALLYLIFAWAVVGAVGAGVTPDAISGIAVWFGANYLIIGGLIGFLAAITSFIGIGVVFEGMLRDDFGFPRALAFAATAAVPAALWALGIQDFIGIIGAVGAVAIGFDGILILLVHRRAQAEGGATPFEIVIPLALRAALILLFAAAGAAKIFDIRLFL